MQWHWDVVPLQNPTGLELVRRPQWDSAREQLVGHLMQDVDLLPAARGHSHWVTQGLAMSLSRQNNGLKWGKWATWKPNRLTYTQQGKGLESQSCQLLNQGGMMQGFTVTLKVTEPGVIFWWVSLGWAAVIFMSDQQLLFQLGQSLKGTALKEQQPHAPHQNIPQKPLLPLPHSTLCRKHCPPTALPLYMLECNAIPPLCFCWLKPDPCYFKQEFIVFNTL